jgi:hypothetical protein
MSADLTRDGRSAAGQLHQAELSEQTQHEHDELLECMHRLEAALASPAPGRERDWARRAGGELQSVEASLRRHVESAEGSRGLFAELDLSRGSIPTRVDRLRREHQELLAFARQLTEHLQQPEPLPDFVALRREAEELLSALRQHHAREVDLIFECFWLDIGVGD